MSGLSLSPRERALLRACLRQGGDVEEAFAAWRPFANPAAMHGRELRLMPMLLASLRRAGIDDPFLPWLRGHAKHIWLAGALRLRGLRGGLDTLQVAGVPVVLLKGAALLARWRGEAETRPMGDFDLLVPRASVRAALAALHAAGWQGPLANLVTGDDLHRFHALAMLDKAGNALDVHWRPAEAITDPAHAEDVIARSVEAAVDGRRCRVAGLTDHLFVLLAHAFHNQVAQRCDWVAEADMMLRRGAADEWDWPLFRTLCRRYRLEAWARRSLSLVSAISGHPLPQGAPSTANGRALWAQARQRRAILVGAGSTALPLLADSARDDPEAEFYAALAGQGVADGFAEAGPDGLDFGLQSGGASFLRGWSVPEQGGRWTDGDTALLALRVPQGRAGDTVWLRLHGNPYVPDSDMPLEATVWAGDSETPWRFAQGDAGRRVVAGRLLPWRGGAVLPVRLRFLGLMSAWERVQRDRDPRKLGLFLTKIVVPPDLPVLRGPLRLSEPWADAVALSGWSGAEPGGRWSIAPETQLLFRLAGPPPPAVELLIHRCVATGGDGRRVHAIVNGELCLRTHVQSHDETSARHPSPAQVLSVSLPSSIGKDAIVDLRLRIAAPVSLDPAGFAGNGRQLGIQLAELRPAAIR